MPKSKIEKFVYLWLFSFLRFLLLGAWSRFISAGRCFYEYDIIYNNLNLKFLNIFVIQLLTIITTMNIVCFRRNKATKFVAKRSQKHAIYAE